MKKILQCFFPKLFSKDLKVNNQKPLISDNDFKLELGKIQPVLMPDIMEQKKFEVVK